jgi:hypothetical protein
VAPGQMLIFVSGNYPILGIQTLYFFDPTFKIRAEIPPPTKFVRLKGKPILEQGPVQRPQQLMSPPEVPPPDLSHAEQGFLDGLDDQEDSEESEESEVFEELEESNAAAEEPH